MPRTPEQQHEKMVNDLRDYEAGIARVAEKLTAAQANAVTPIESAVIEHVERSNPSPPPRMPDHPVQEPPPVHVSPPVNERLLPPAHRPSVRENFIRGVTSPNGTKAQSGAIPTVMKPRQR